MNSSKRQLSYLSAPVISAIVAAAALSACGKSDDSQTAGQKLDSAIAQTKQKADEAKTDASQGMAKASESVKEATQDAKESGQQAMENAKQAGNDTADKVKGATADASITTQVNAQLAKDKQLSALKIDVDTNNGHVELHGTAPDAASRDRATQLASAVPGVQSVDNQLTVSGKM